MRAVIQRVSEARVVVESQTVAEIRTGLLVLIGIEVSDNEEDVMWIASKISQMRIFTDSEGKINLSLKDINGELLLVSQFTLHALTKKGNRPSFIKAANPEHAINLYNSAKFHLELLLEKEIQTGVFGANMQVMLCNDGPVTIWLDSKIKE
jgi:D-aminoacyl-tRNA deacylase